MSLLETLLDPDNRENIVLTGEDGVEEEFEQIALIPLDDDVYVFLLPVEEEDGMLIFRMVLQEDGSEGLVFEDDEEKQQRAYKAYLDLCDAEGVE